MKSEHQIYAVLCVVALIFIKSCLFPGWVSAVELIAALILLGTRWLFEPKVVERFSACELEKVKEQLSAELLKAKESLSKSDSKLKGLEDKVGGIALKLGFAR